MEQLAQLSIMHTDTSYRFRLDLPDDGHTQMLSVSGSQEYTIEVAPEVSERLRRLLHTTTQQMQQATDPKAQRRGGASDALMALGRYLFDNFLPPPLQEVLRQLEAPLVLQTNSSQIPWELLYDHKSVPGRFLCQHVNIGRQATAGRGLQRFTNERAGESLGVHKTRKLGGRRDGQGLNVLFLVNPTSDRSLAEEEVATLCTTLPESISRIILYRQQANQLEMRMRMSAEQPQIVHYAGPVPQVSSTGGAILNLAGSSRLDGSAATQLFQSLPRRPLVFLSYYDAMQVGTLPPEETENLAASLIASGAGAVIAMRWPVDIQRAREFIVTLYQEIADGVPLGEAMKRARVIMAQRRLEDVAWAAYVLYGDPSVPLTTAIPGARERPLDLPFEPFDDEHMMQPMFPSSNTLDRRFLQEVLGMAMVEARRMRKDYLGTPHLFIALTKLDGGCTQDALHTLNFSPRQVREVIRMALGSGKATSDTPVLPTRRCKEILLTAERNAVKAGSAVVDERAIAQAVLGERDGVTYELLTKMGINPGHLVDLLTSSNARALLELVPSVSANSPAAQVELPVGIGPELGGPKGGNSVLERLGRDLTRQASMRQLPPLIGREKEMRLLIQTLMLKDRNNPILIGDSGVGKTTIVAGLAQRIVDGKVPPELRGKRLIELSASSLVAGTKYRGEFEERLLKVLEEAEGGGDIILFIDEMHLLIGTGRAADGSIDAAGILKPALAGGRLRFIGATTPQEYRAIEKDAAMERRLRPIQIDEPSTDEALAILMGMCELYEQHHHVDILKETLQAAVQLSVQYLPNLRLPDKACGVLDEACSQARVFLAEDKAEECVDESGEEDMDLDLDERPIITPALIAEVISHRTGIPVRAPGREERDRLLNLEALLKRRVIGQDEAISRVTQAIQVARAGLKPRNRPSGVFLFLGPTGVGKTELARALAAEVFGSDEHLIRVDMSEYMEKHAVSRMIGAPPGYIGHDQEGQLTGKLRRRPHCVVLLDEVEKAHPEVFDLFLQVFDAGRLTDAQGHTVDAQHAIWIMTSNVGTDMLGRSVPHGFRSSIKATAEEMQRDRLLERLRETFRPEFLNRIDEVVIFRPLMTEQARAITRLQMNELAARLLEQGLILQADESAIDLLCTEGFSATQGARPLRRVIEKLLTVPLSLRILLANIPERGEVHVSAVDGKLAIEIRELGQVVPRTPTREEDEQEHVEIDAL